MAKETEPAADQPANSGSVAVVIETISTVVVTADVIDVFCDLCAAFDAGTPGELRAAGWQLLRGEAFCPCHD